MIRNFFFTTLVWLLSMAIFVFTITQLDPIGTQSEIALSAFFVSLFFGGATLMTFIFFFGAEVQVLHRLGVKNFQIALRRGGLVGVLLTGTAGMRIFGLLGWIQWGLFVIFLVLVELIFLASRQK